MNRSNTPLYDGKDHNLKPEPYCFACRHYGNRIVVASLQRCSRCQVAWYCSSECQKKHFQLHRKLCKRIEDERNRVDTEAIPLRTFVDPWQDNAVAENIFETRIGEFGELDETEKYLKACAKLAKSYWMAAYDCEVKEVWEKALFHYLELLRLDEMNGFNTKFRVPFILLYLNRDDDAYAFIRYCLQYDDLDPDEILVKHKHSREGDWIYDVEENCRYRDIFEECPNIDDVDLPGPHIVALAIIKLRIFEAHYAVSRTLDFVFKKSNGKRIQEVRPLVQDMLLDRNVDIDDQQDVLDSLLERIPPFMFEAISKLKGVCESKCALEMEELTRRFEFPVNVTLFSGARLFCRVPGVDEVIRSW
jgi:hypothetical protein